MIFPSAYLCDLPFGLTTFLDKCFTQEFTYLNEKKRFLFRSSVHTNLPVLFLIHELAARKNSFRYIRHYCI